MSEVTQWLHLDPAYMLNQAKLDVSGWPMLGHIAARTSGCPGSIHSASTHTWGMYAYVCVQASHVCCYSMAPQRSTSTRTPLQHALQQLSQFNELQSQQLITPMPSARALTSRKQCCVSNRLQSTTCLHAQQQKQHGKRQLSDTHQRLCDACASCSSGLRCSAAGRWETCACSSPQGDTKKMHEYTC
jgi:hypothetical protein